MKIFPFLNLPISILYTVKFCRTQVPGTKVHIFILLGFADNKVLLKYFYTFMHSENNENPSMVSKKIFDLIFEQTMVCISFEKG